jgi:hypothetical protein
MPAARRFSEHGAVGAGVEIPETGQITVSARAVHGVAD